MEHLLIGITHVKNQQPPHAFHQISNQIKSNFIFRKHCSTRRLKISWKYSASVLIVCQLFVDVRLFLHLRIEYCGSNADVKLRLQIVCVDILTIYRYMEQRHVSLQLADWPGTLFGRGSSAHRLLSDHTSSPQNR